MSSDAQMSFAFKELLINEVKSRASLYSKDPKFNISENEKKSLWEEVAYAVFSDIWMKLNKEERKKKIQFVQRKWKYFRKCFANELKRQKDATWSHDLTHERRKYHLYDQLIFLKSEFDDADEEPEFGIDLPIKTDIDNTTITLDTNIDELPISEIISVYKSNDREIYTECNNFALSLVPLLSDMTVDQRIAAQIAVLKVLKNIKNDTYIEKKKFESADKIKDEVEKNESETVEFDQIRISIRQTWVIPQEVEKNNYKIEDNLQEMNIPRKTRIHQNDEVETKKRKVDDYFEKRISPRKARIHQNDEVETKKRKVDDHFEKRISPRKTRLNQNDVVDKEEDKVNEHNQKMLSHRELAFIKVMQWNTSN